MPDDPHPDGLAALLAEQARLRPRLEALLARAAGWLDPPAAAPEAPAASSPGEHPHDAVAALGRDAATEAGPPAAAPTGLAPSQAPPPAARPAGAGGVAGGRTASEAATSPAHGRITPGHAIADRGTALGEAPATAAALTPPRLRLRPPRTPHSPLARVMPDAAPFAAPFAALLAATAQPQQRLPLPDHAAPPAPRMPAAAWLASGPLVAPSLAPPATPPAPTATQSPQGIAAAPLARLGDAAGFVPAPAMGWGDEGLEEQLADILERAALEAGIALP